jgi:hypothetical protein
MSRGESGSHRDMTATTRTIQEQGVMVVESDIPEGLTINQYRRGRRREALRAERARGGSSRRRSRRSRI